MKRLRFKLPASLVIVLACASGLGAIQLVSVEQEIEIGREANQEIRKQVPELTDATVNRYVDRLGAQLVAHAPGARYPYNFSVANASEANAFALPGGPIWVHRGAIQAARTESQIAGVMAHEVAHIAQRHSADQLTKATVANGLLGLLGAVLDGGGRGEAAARLGAGFATQSLFMKFSRDDEREADQVGVQIMRKAGWDPHGMVEFFALLRDQQKRSPGSVENFFSSHPTPASRIDELKELVGSRSGRRDSAEFQRVHARLQSLPAAPAPRRR